MHMRNRRHRGASLLEVMIALFVITIGLLGIAKMQALAMANTRGSSTRSLVSVEVAGLASAMHANRLYWQSVTGTAATFTVNVSNGAVTSASDNNLTSVSVNCQTASCIVAADPGSAMAVYDLSQWAVNLNSLVNGATAVITCNSTPVACTIAVSWNENVVGANQGVNLSSGTTVTPVANQTLANSYEVLVEP